MPPYGALSSATALYPGDSYLCINAEKPVNGTLSQIVALSQKDAGNGQHISAEITFAGVPGAFEVDVMTSDTDNPNDFVPVTGGAVTTVGTGNAGRVELNVNALFAALLTKTANANAVNCTGKITQH